MEEGRERKMEGGIGREGRRISGREREREREIEKLVFPLIKYN